MTISEVSSNRTFMELKSALPYVSYADIESSNRTFMELKFETTLQETNQLPVLIVPLWN